MSDLVISLDHVPRADVPPQRLDDLRDEFDAAGMTKGRFTIGEVTAEPTMVYFLWHDSGEVPVSMLSDRGSFKDEAATRAAAKAFLAKWTRRLH